MEKTHFLWPSLSSIWNCDFLSFSRFYFQSGLNGYILQKFGRWHLFQIYHSVKIYSFYVYFSVILVGIFFFLREKTLCSVSQTWTGESTLFKTSICNQDFSILLFSLLKNLKQISQGQVRSILGFAPGSSLDMINQSPLQRHVLDVFFLRVRMGRPPCLAFQGI